MSSRPRAVIVGAGFAGLSAARALSGRGFDIRIVDSRNYHTFLPLLYQVASAELEPEQIAYPVRFIFRSMRDIDFTMATVSGLDLENKALETDVGPIGYDYLLLCPGSATSFFGTPGAQEHAFNLKTLDQGVALRNRVMSCFERASLESDPAIRLRYMTFVIVGGGPTGVELAGALAELVRGPVTKDFKGFDVTLESRIVLLQSPDAILPPFPGRLRDWALKELRAKGVEVRLKCRVGEVGPDFVRTTDGTEIGTETVIWTAGVCAPPEVAQWGLPTGAQGRIVVGPTLQVLSRPEVFVAGDSCVIPDAAPVPMVAPAAIQQGERAAANIFLLHSGLAPQPFHYEDKGSLATIGRNAAVAHFPRWGKERKGMDFTGFPAWVLWVFIHLFSLMGFKNRILTLIDWAVDYVTFEKGVRLILPSPKAGRSALISDSAELKRKPKKKSAP